MPVAAIFSLCHQFFYNYDAYFFTSQESPSLNGTDFYILPMFISDCKIIRSFIDHFNLNAQ